MSRKLGRKSEKREDAIFVWAFTQLVTTALKLIFLKNYKKKCQEVVAVEARSMQQFARVVRGGDRGAGVELIKIHSLATRDRGRGWPLVRDTEAQEPHQVGRDQLLPLVLLESVSRLILFE